MQKPLSYQILDKETVKKIYQDYFISCQVKAKTFVDNLSLPPQEAKIFLKKLSSFMLFCAKYNISEEYIRNNLKKIQTLPLLNEFIQNEKKLITEKKLQEKKILLKGEIERRVRDYQTPDFFKNHQRIYIKINKIPDSYSFIRESVKFINNHLSEQMGISLICQQQTTFIKSQQGKTKEKVYYKYIITDNTHTETKIGKFLHHFSQKTNDLIVFLKGLTANEVIEFLSYFKDENELSSAFQKKLNLFFKHKQASPLKFTPALFSLVKKGMLMPEMEIIPYLSFFSKELLKIKTTIQELQTKSLENPITTSVEGDLILLSIHPKDIARISEYTDWETCMSYEGEYMHDLYFQIGCGSVVAYLVNSKNPYKKLSRILLKPYIQENEHLTQINRLNIFYQGEVKKKLKMIDCQISLLQNLKKTRQEFYKIFNTINKNLPKMPQEKPILYLADSQFGIQNPLFRDYLNELNKKYLSEPNPKDAFFSFGSYYREKLNQTYFFSDPNNPEHLIKFLNMNKCLFHATTNNNQTYIFTKHIYAKDVSHLNLSGVRAEQVSIQADSLKCIDKRGLKTNVLTLFNCSNALNIPSNLQITDRLTIEGENLTILPPNINTKELIVSAPSLRFIPNTLNVDSLSIINTNIEKLPPLKLNYLNAKGSKIKDLRNIQVNEFLDLSSTPIQFLSKTLNVSFLILKNCQNLKQLPENLTIQGLDISNTSLSNIPNIHYQWLLMNNHKNLETLPDGISFNVLEAQNSVLKTIPNNICANRVNISKRLFLTYLII
ncbi:MAG: hypothetical protein J6V53_03190 [Alphaproteobacteria bacterium]|nr:hypothetical protein [Alphaproteobacteria bacterium]